MIHTINSSSNIIMHMKSPRIRDFPYKNLCTIHEFPISNPCIDPKCWIHEFPQGKLCIIRKLPYYNPPISLKFVKNKNITNQEEIRVGLETSLTPLTILSSQSFLPNNYKNIRAGGGGDQIWKQSHAGEFPLRRGAWGLRSRFPKKLHKVDDM